MEVFLLGVYNFFSSNIIVTTLILILGVLATIVEKSEKIKTPIQTIIKNRRARKQAIIDREERKESMMQSMLSKLDNLESKVDKLEGKVDKLEGKVDKLEGKVDKLEDRVLENEADRLRDVLFTCGNACRRKVPLDGESYRHIQDVYKKYSETLHQNGAGHDEYEFITKYYNSQNF